MNEIHATCVERKPPSHPDGIKQVQVGCGPHNVLPHWWNVDIRGFKGIDEIMDVTKPWAWEGILDFVYGEHFLEHLELGGAINFLHSSIKALGPGGKIRLSTPSLEWVLATHFDLGSNEEQSKIQQTFAVNRAFHGWGHRFLYSQSLLKKIIASVGFENVEFFSYGESNDPQLVDMERHGGFRVSQGFPSVWIVEATRPRSGFVVDDKFLDRCRGDYIKYVASGH
jgi:predicted SAM-dependent methyltransferase